MKYDMIKLKELCIVNQGLQIPISKRYKEPGENRYFYITVQFLKDNGENYYIENPPKNVTCTEDEILVVRTGNTGQVITGVAGCFHNNFFKVTPNEKVFPKYLYYALNNKRMHDAMLNAASGTTIPDLKHSSFYDLEIPLPEICIQKKIAKILDNICNKLKLNNEINNNLYELAINYLNKKIDINEVPVNKFAKIQGGYAFKSKDLIDTYTKNRIIKIKNLRNEINADVINSQFVEDEVVEKLDNKFKLSKGDVAIAMTGAELGKTGFIYGNDNYYLNQRVGVIRGNSKASELYLNILFLSDDFQTLLNSKGYGSAQPNVSTTDIENILINDITEDNLNEFYERIKSIYERIIVNSEEILNLEQLRDTILPKLMNGEIDLDNIEI